MLAADAQNLRLPHGGFQADDDEWVNLGVLICFGAFDQGLDLVNGEVSYPPLIFLMPPNFAGRVDNRGGAKEVDRILEDVRLFIENHGDSRFALKDGNDTACAFGGSRQWFVCPYCNRRVTVVVVDGAYVACRHCLKLTYASCNEDQIDRSWSKRDKYKAKLGGDKGQYLKPKGMHQRTWQQLRHQYYEAEMQGWEWAESRFEAIRGE